MTLIQTDDFNSQIEIKNVGFQEDDDSLLLLNGHNSKANNDSLDLPTGQTTPPHQFSTKPPQSSFPNPPDHRPSYALPPVNQQYVQGSPPPTRNPEEERRKKATYLVQLEDLYDRFPSSVRRAYTMHDDITEIHDELTFLKAQIEKDERLKTWRRNLLLVSYGINAANDYLNPLKIDMTPWTKEMRYEVEQAKSYDHVLGKLSEKYTLAAEIPPELQLVWMMGSSFGKHMVILKKNADIMKKAHERGRRFQQMKYDSLNNLSKPIIPPSKVSDTDKSKELQKLASEIKKEKEILIKENPQLDNFPLINHQDAQSDNGDHEESEVPVGPSIDPSKLEFIDDSDDTDGDDEQKSNNSFATTFTQGGSKKRKRGGGSKKKAVDIVLDI